MEQLVHFPCKNIASVLAFLYLSNHPGIHSIVHIRLESTPANDLLLYPHNAFMIVEQFQRNSESHHIILITRENAQRIMAV